MSVWSKIYERINWKDLPQRLTALAARNLNKMDLAIDTLDDRTIGLNTRLEAVEENPITVDTELKPDSENPVQNKVIYAAFEDLLPEETVQGNPISISDASGLNAKACSVDLLPIQDLHGYDSPWVGGAGKNKLKVTATTQTINGVTFTVNSDGTISLSGTASNTTILDVATFSAVGGTAYKLSGCPSGGSATKYLLSIPAVGYDSGSGYNYSPSTSADVLVRITIYSGQNTQGLVFKPMICLASATNPDYAHYEPYSNICPISGRNSVTVKRTGKNQCDTLAFVGVSHYTVNTDGSITVNSSDTRGWSSVTEIPLKAGTYTVSKSGTIGTSDIRLSTEEFNTGHIFATSFTFTLATDGSVKVKLAYGGVTYPQTYTLQIESGSTATAYEPYQGETHTATFSDTVYGGKADFVSGKLTIDKEYRLFNGTENWQVSGTGTDHYFYNINLGSATYAVQGDIISDKFETASVSQYNTTVGTIFCTPQYIRIRPFSTELSVNDWKTWLQSNNVQVAFGIQTPIEITLTSEQISLLKGNNVISTDGDNIILKYSADIKAWVENQLSV